MTINPIVSSFVVVNGLALFILWAHATVSRIEQRWAHDLPRLLDADRHRHQWTADPGNPLVKCATCPAVVVRRWTS